jgi:hypothetical protein
MQIYHNVLSQELIQDCWKEVEYLSKQKVWSSSSTTWGEGTMQGVTGSTLITKVPTTTENKIIECISKYYPNDTEYIIQYFVWQNYSGIAFHSDGNYRSGATIYLNEEWDENFGGLFIWKEDGNEIMKAIAPKRNMMVLNNQREFHSVTPISPLCKEFRCTIQIWDLGKRGETWINIGGI